MVENKIARTIFLILTILTMVTIFIFSNQGGTQSSSISTGVTKWIIEINPKIKNMEEEQKQEIIEKVQPIIRKIAHFTIYMTLGIMFMGFISTYKVEEKKKIIITVLFGLIYAITDEIHQGITGEGRSPRVFDVYIDTLGTTTGFFIMLGITQLISNRQNSTKTKIKLH